MKKWGFVIISDFHIAIIIDLPTAPGIERTDYIYNKKVYGYGEGARGHNNFKEEDKICFYVSSLKSVALYGTISKEQRPGSPPGNWDINNVDGYKNFYDTEIELKDVHYVSPHVKIADVREKLGWSKSWGNHVRSAHKITENEFNILTSQI